MEQTIQEKTADTIRILSAEAITRAGTGHPGICFDAAPIIYNIYAEAMNFSYKNPEWENRDRFVLSAGHGSAMLYTTLHLFGFGVTKNDLMNFRQFKSITPGHPERGVTAGVDVSTGPLGQGIANAVGLAMAEAHLAAKFNREDYNIVDHYTYVLCGDGCLEKGISYEACSFAGAQKLGKLILFYDKNNITIEGNTSCTFNDDIAARFNAQGWQVIEVQNAEDLDELKRATLFAKSDLSRPSIIICHTVIGRGTPFEGSSAIHGTPLTEEQLEKTKLAYNWNEQPFEVPVAVRYHCDRISKEKYCKELEWNDLFRRYSKEYPELAEEYKRYFGGYVPQLKTENFGFTEKTEATRVSGAKVINKLLEFVPNMMSGSADLSPSTRTNLKNEEYFSPENRLGRNIHFGIREHAMAAICNGIKLHGGLFVFCSTFLTFADYMKGAMRMSAIMKLPVIYILTHDSIGVGEDGPTHQPVEQIASLRATPDLKVYRPCDYGETAAAYISALNGNGPAAIILSRQNLVQYPYDENALKGGYIIDSCNTKPDVLLIATGSEVGICSEAKKLLGGEEIEANVISLPCVETFNEQSESYRESVMPSDVKVRVVVEAASQSVIADFAGDCGEKIFMQTFGLSAPYETLYKHFGFTKENIVAAAKNSIALSKINYT